MAYMTRDEMATEIRQGNSVLHKGRLYTDVAALPSESELALASGDAAEIRSAEDSLDLQIRTLQEAKAKLQKLPAEAASQPPATEDPSKAAAPQPPAKPAPAAATLAVAPTKPQAPASK